MAWSEDRALVRTNSSAVPSEKAKGGSIVRCCHSSFVFSAMRKTFGHDARSYRHDAAILYYEPVSKFQFPVNQDMRALRQRLVDVDS